MGIALNGMIFMLDRATFCKDEVCTYDSFSVLYIRSNVPSSFLSFDFVNVGT